VKNIVFCSVPKFLWFLKNFTIYIRSSFRKEQSKKGIVIVQDDILTASDLSNYQSSYVKDRLIEKLVKKKQVQFLLDWGGKTYIDFFIGRQILKDIDSIYESINYAKPNINSMHGTCSIIERLQKFFLYNIYL
jgi:hypothetical protein